MPQPTRLSYKDFSKEEINSLAFHGVLNGIGPQSPAWLTKLIKWVMRHILYSWLTEASGNIHDLTYQFGGTERDRYQDDMGFYLMILHDAVNNSKSSFLFILRASVGIAFKYAVRAGGMRRFYYIDPDNPQYKTKEEIMDMRFEEKIE